MKKIFALIMVFALAVSMSACTQLENLKSIELPPLPTVTPESTEEPMVVLTPEPTVEPTVEPAKANDLSNPIIINIKKTSYQEFDPAEGTQLILTFDYETPTIYIEGRDEQAAKINDVLAQMDEDYYTGNGDSNGLPSGFNMMLELAQDNYGLVVENGAEDLSMELVSSRGATVARADNQALTLVYNYYVYTAGVHGHYFDRGYVFDATSGELISLDQLTSDFDAFTAFLVEYMVTKAESDEYYAERIAPDYAAPEQYSAAFEALLREGSWYFDSEGLVIFSDLYELGPYAAGTVEFKVPYSELVGVIDEKWIPAERDGEGEFSVKALADVEDGSLEIVDRLTADSEGTELCLIVQGTVYDVKISRVAYSDAFYEIEQLWHCSALKDSALQLVSIIPEGMPNLMLSYNTADGAAHKLLISQNGYDGSFILVDDSIAAVG